MKFRGVNTLPVDMSTITELGLDGEISRYIEKEIRHQMQMRSLSTGGSMKALTPALLEELAGNKDYREMLVMALRDIFIEFPSLFSEVVQQVEENQPGAKRRKLN